MTRNDESQNRATLARIARRVMLEKGFLPDFTSLALAQAAAAAPVLPQAGGNVRDLRGLLWCSVDNDDSRDLDQLTVAESLPGGATRVMVAIADVSATVPRPSAVNDHAEHNTTSVYTVAQVFPMLPERFSTDLTSLNFNEDRAAMIVDMQFSADGQLQESSVYQAIVHNHAKLAYNSVAAWLEGPGDMPREIAAVPELAGTIQLQDQIAQKLKARRQSFGALDFQTIETRPLFVGNWLKDLTTEEHNRANDIIAEFMVAANGVVAQFLTSHQMPTIQRVVRTPKKWERIVEIAAEKHFPLPPMPDAKSLREFLAFAKKKDPVGFPDLSLSVIKSLGSGEYVLQRAGQESEGHFALAVQDYTHFTAPNRRYPDMITHRMLKAVMSGGNMPYTEDELAELARQCSVMESAAKKVERQVGKSAAAMLLQNRIGQQFNAIVTGASSKGTWVRLLDPAIEGKLTRGYERLDVGHRLRVQLAHTDIEHGFIDFRRIY